MVGKLDFSRLFFIFPGVAKKINALPPPTEVSNIDILSLLPLHSPPWDVFPAVRKN